MGTYLQRITPYTQLMFDSATGALIGIQNPNSWGPDMRMDGSTGVGGGSISAPFSTTISLTTGGNVYMDPEQTVTGPMTLTVAASSVRNSLVYARLVADGVNVPSVVGAPEWAASLGYDNRAGIVNVLQVFSDGYSKYYSWGQALSSAATGVTLSGPTSGTSGVASTNFTVGVTPSGGSITGSVVVTPSSGGGGGTFSPTTVTLTSASPTATFTYTPASSGAKTISVTNNGSLTNPTAIVYTSNAVDSTAPVLQSATVNGATLVLAYNETLNTATPALTSYSYVLNGAAAVNPTAAVVSGANVTLTFAVAATQGQTATLSYTPGTNSIRDAAGNAAASLSSQAVTNSTPASDVTAPVIQSAVMNGASLVMTYNEALTANSPTLASLSIVVNGGAGVNPTAATASGTTVTITFAAPVTSGQTVALTYTAGATAIKDAAGNNAANLTSYSVTNNTAAVGSSPLQFSNATTGSPIYYAEVVGGGGSYSYTSNANVINNNFSAASSPVSDLSLPAGQDGSFSHAFAGDAASAVMIAGIKTGATKPANSAFATWDCMLQTPAAIGGAYVTKTGAGANQTSSVVAAAGDVVRLRRTGTAIVAEVARAADLNTWINIATPIASGSTGTLWATFCAQTSARTIEDTRYSGAWA